MKDRYYIALDNDRFKSVRNKIAGLMKEWSYRLQIRKNLRYKLNTADREYKKEVKAYYRQYGFRNVDTYWHGFYENLSGIKDKKYIPEYIFYRYIQPSFNNLEFATSYSDKNTYQQYGDIVRVPESYLYNINGVYYDQRNQRIDFKKAIYLLETIDRDYIIKPSIDTGFAFNVYKIKRIEQGLLLGGQKTTSKDILEKYKNNFVIQEVIGQPQVLADIYPYALNTVRVFTARVGDEVVCLQSTILFGDSGGATSNGPTGTVHCIIDDDGKISEKGIANLYKVVDCHPYTKVPFKGARLVNYPEMKEKAILLHHRLPYFKLISWDLCFDENNEVTLIEFNLKHQGISVFQKKSGPLFGEYTDRILKEVFGKED